MPNGWSIAGFSRCPVCALESAIGAAAAVAKLPLAQCNYCMRMVFTWMSDDEPMRNTRMALERRFGTIDFDDWPLGTCACCNVVEKLLVLRSERHEVRAACPRCLSPVLPHQAAAEAVGGTTE